MMQRVIFKNTQHCGYSPVYAPVRFSIWSTVNPSSTPMLTGPDDEPVLVSSSPQPPLRPSSPGRGKELLFPSSHRLSPFSERSFLTTLPHTCSLQHLRLPKDQM